MTVNSNSTKPKRKIFDWIAPFISVAIGVAILYASQLVVAIGFVAMNIDYNKYQGTYDFIYALVAIVALLLYSYVSRLFYSDFKSGLLIKKPGGFEVFSTIVVAMGLLGFVTVYMLIVNQLAEMGEAAGSSVVSEQLERYETSVDRYSEIAVDVVPTFDKILNYIALAVLVPIAEELLFRGIILGQLIKKYHPLFSILFAATVFGVMHGLSIHVGYALACGAVIGAMYYFTSNISMTILIHMIFNFFGGTLSMILTDGWINISEEVADSIMGYAVYLELFSLTPAVVLFIVLLVKRINASKNKYQIEVKVEEEKKPEEFDIEIL